MRCRRLKGLFESFKYVCSPSVVLQQSKIKPPKLAEVLKKAEDSGLAYFAKLVEFVRGNYGASQLFAKSLIDASVDEKKLWKSFAADLTQIAQFKSLAEKPGTSISKQEISYIRDLYETLLAKPHGAEHALIFAVLNATKLAIGKKAALCNNRQRDSCKS